MKFTLFCALVLAGCTKPNPAVCCLDQADCSEVGLDEIRTCSAGLACVEHQCDVPSCSTMGCMSNAPVCNITTDVCDPCTDSSQCTRFADAPICEPTSGGCVQCVAAADCSGTTPVCDANACRGCRLDSECATNACGDDGSCVAEDRVVYVSPSGADSGGCTHGTPCNTFDYALTRTSQSRPHLALLPGSYVGQLRVQEASTTARPLYVHGGGATIVGPQGLDGTVVQFLIDVSLKNLVVDATAAGSAVQIASAGVNSVKGLRVRNAGLCISVSGMSSLQDIDVESCAVGIEVRGAMTLDRVVIAGGESAIRSTLAAATVKISNLLTYGTTGIALDLQYASGTISFATIADSGGAGSSSASSLRCGTGLSVTSSIVWSPSSALPPITNCSIANTIAGPVTVAGATNSNPQFVSAANRDYHLLPNSPGIDAVDAGPPVDFEGDARPRGARFDIGADEAQ